MNTEEKNKKEEIRGSLKGLFNKASDVAKKTASTVQQGAISLSEKTQKTIHEQQMKKYRPITLKEFRSKSFDLPNVIEIVDDTIRKSIKVCEGAIGWIEEHKGVEVLHLSDEYIEKSGLAFIPIPRCDNVYCVDNFDKTSFINTNYTFAKTNEEKLAELSNIAYCLGAKSCSIEILEENVNIQSNAYSLKAAAKCTSGANAECKSYMASSDKSSGKRVITFEGNNTPSRPNLKWFAYDENIKGLIEMRCSENNTIKSTVLELNAASSSTMSRKVACAIDNILKVSGGMSMESQAIKEHTTKLLFEIAF